MNRQRATSGWPTGSPVRRDSFGGRTVGFDAASSGMRLTSGARTTNAFGRRKSAASGLSKGTRATAEGWRAGARTTAPPFGVGCRIAKPPFGDATRSASETNRLRAIRARCVGCLRVDPLASEPPFGVVGTRPRCLLREGPEPRCDRFQRRPSGIRRDGGGTRRPSGRRHRHRRPPTFGSRGQHRRRSQTKPKHFAFPSTFGSRGRQRVYSHGETPSRSGRRGNARQHRNVSTQNPWEHRAVRSGNAAWPQRTPRWNKALRSAPREAHRGNTEAVVQRTTRGHANR